jgi:hypothetical protein
MFACRSMELQHCGLKNKNRRIYSSIGSATPVFTAWRFSRKLCERQAAQRTAFLYDVIVRSGCRKVDADHILAVSSDRM